MERQTENKEVSEEATATLTDIQNALQGTGRRLKRTAAALTSCSEFEEKYQQFLTAIISLADNEEESVATMKGVTPVLQATVPAVPCDDQAKQQIKEDTAEDAASATTTAQTFIREKEEKIKEIVEIVIEAQKIISEANKELIDNGQTTIAAFTLGFTIPTTATETDNTTRTNSTTSFTEGLTSTLPPTTEDKDRTQLPTTSKGDSTQYTYTISPSQPLITTKMMTTSTAPTASTDQSLSYNSSLKPFLVRSKIIK